MVGAGEKADEIADGDLLLIDGAAGEVVAQPDEQTLADFAGAPKADAAHRAMLAQYKDKEGATSDGRRVIIEGNIGTPDDAVRVASLAVKASVCSARSSCSWIVPTCRARKSSSPPTKKACEIMQGKPVIIRTLDIGGDKEVPALALEKEQNPFLGYRAIRICLNQPELFLIQLRALLRAAQYGDLRIMFPMISSVDEVRGAKQVLEQARTG